MLFCSLLMRWTSNIAYVNSELIVKGCLHWLGKPEYCGVSPSLLVIYPDICICMIFIIEHNTLYTFLTQMWKNNPELRVWQLNAEAAVVQHRSLQSVIRKCAYKVNLQHRLICTQCCYLIFQFCEEWVILSLGCLFSSFQYLALVEMWRVCAGVQKMCLKHPSLDLILAEAWSEQECTVFLAIFDWLKNNLFN